MKEIDVTQKIQELMFECISEGYDMSHLSHISDDVLLFFHDLKDFRNWDGLFIKNDPSKITKEDVLKSILKTDYVSLNKIQCVEWCLENGLSVKPLLSADYDDVSSYAIYCGICAGVDEKYLINDKKLLSLEEIHEIIRQHKNKAIIVK